MHPIRKQFLVLTLGLAPCLLSACGDGEAADAVKRSETAVNDIDGAVWMTCAVGQTFDASAGACTGEPAAIPCEETLTTCPEGFALPTKDNFQNALCGLIGSMDDVCATDRFMSCAKCDVCTALFGQDTGSYPIREGYVRDGMYIGEVVHFETGCSDDDGFPDTLCNVRCVKTEAESSTDSEHSKACADATTKESCEVMTGCRALLGNRIDKTQNCISTASTFLECMSDSVDCDTALGYARDPETYECYQFPSLCFPTGWIESGDCGGANAASCDPV